MKFSRKLLNTNTILGLLLIAASLIATCAAQGAAQSGSCPTCLMDDRNNTQMNKFNDTRDAGYCEILMTCPGAGTGVFTAFGLNSETDYPNDSCPSNLFANFSVAAVEKQYGASNVFMNGPRRWLTDSMMMFESKTVRNLSGIDTRWEATPSAQTGGFNYNIQNVTCDRAWFYAKGKPVFILDAPDGTPYVMQAFSLQVDQNLTYKDLPTLGDKLQLPAGWKYRTEVLTQNLTINGINGTKWRVTQDNLQNTYSGCWKSGNQTSCNFQP